MPKIKPIKLVIIIVCIVIIALLAWKFFKPKQQQPQYITAEVTRGDIENNVLATGTLDATKLISVGAQVSGQVKKMYVQLGDQVKQGQLIAQIDSTTQENSLVLRLLNLPATQSSCAKNDAILGSFICERAPYVDDSALDKFFLYISGALLLIELVAVTHGRARLIETSGKLCADGLQRGWNFRFNPDGCIT